jgi:hypothetical protein
MPYSNYKLVESYHWPDGVYRGSIERFWNRSGSPPFHQPTAYRYNLWYVTDSTASDGLNFYVPPRSPGTQDDSLARNAAYEQLMGSLGNTSSWGTNLAEVGQATSTCERRLLQLGRFARALRNKDFYGAKQALGESIIPSGVSRKKAFADNFLEWHFGWEPMVQDIHSACDTMSKADFGTRKIRGSSSTPFSWQSYDSGSNGDYHEQFVAGTIRVKMGGKVRITNESAFLASQMGLINPLTVAWDLVPFSFVVDWFANVGQVLGAVTGFVGVDLSDAYTTSSQEFTFRDFAVSYGFNPETGLWDIVTFTNNVSHGFDLRRVPGISGPSLAVKPFKGFSPTRGLTACALLLQKLR